MPHPHYETAPPDPISHFRRIACHLAPGFRYLEIGGHARGREEGSRAGQSLHRSPHQRTRHACARAATAERCPARHEDVSAPIDDGTDRAVMAAPWERPPASPRVPDGLRRPVAMRMIRRHPRMADRTVMAGSDRVPAGLSRVLIDGVVGVGARRERSDRRSRVPCEAPAPSIGDDSTASEEARSDRRAGFRVTCYGGCFVALVR